MKVNCLLYAPAALPTVTVPLPNEEGLGGPRASVDVLEKRNWPAGNRTAIFPSSITCHCTDYAMHSKSNGTFLSLGMMGRFIVAGINRSSRKMCFLCPIVRKIIFWQNFPLKFPDVKLGEDLFSCSWTHILIVFPQECKLAWKYELRRRPQWKNVCRKLEPVIFPVK
jgi:hypothetical protein